MLSGKGQKRRDKAPCVLSLVCESLKKKTSQSKCRIVTYWSVGRGAGGMDEGKAGWA